MLYDRIVHLRGKMYHAATIDAELRRDYATWLRRRLLLAREGLRQRDPAAYEAESDEFAADLASVRDDMRDLVTRRVIETPGGTLAFLALLFGCSLDEARNLVRERGERVQAIVRDAVAEALGELPAA